MKKQEQKTIVTPGTTKAEYIARGTARKTKDKKSIIVTMFDGTKLYITQAKSYKQLQYYASKNHQYFDEFIVQEIVEQQDLKPQHAQEAPKKDK